MEAQLIKAIKLSNFTELYSLTNEKQYSINNLTQKHLFYKQFLAWSCNGSSVAPISDYIDNPRRQKRKQKGGAFPIGLTASLAGPLLGEVAKPIFKKIIGR